MTLDEFYQLPIEKYVNRNVLSIESKESVQKAIEIMTHNNIGSLIVHYEENRYGILSERDVIKEYAMELYDFSEKSVGEIMTVSPIIIEIHESLGAAFKLMDKNKIRHLPVEDAGKIIGLISLRDLAHTMVKNMPVSTPSTKSAAKRKKTA